MNLKDLIPFGVLLPFLIIVGLEILGSYFLDIFNNSLNNKIFLLESQLKNKEEEIINKLKVDDSFVVFSQTVNITEILKRRNSVKKVIDRFNSLMPKFLDLSQFNYNNKQQEISFSGSVNNLENYLRFSKYLDNHPLFELKFISPPNISKESGKVDFSVTIKLKPGFYQ